MTGRQSDFGFSELAAPASGEAAGSITPEAFADRLFSLLGDTLLAVFLHGPDARRAGTAPEPPEYTMVVVLRELGVAELDRAAPLVREWAGTGQPLPLFFSEGRLANSAATFPVELLDLKECHRILFGKDLLSPLEVRKNNLLQEVESGLKMQLHRLSQIRMLLLGDSPGTVRAISGRLPHLNLLLRSVLRFYTPQQPTGMIEVVRKLDIYLPGAAKGLLALYRFAWSIEIDGCEKSSDDRALFDSVIQSLGKVIAGVEGLREKREKAH